MKCLHSFGFLLYLSCVFHVRLAMPVMTCTQVVLVFDLICQPVYTLVVTHTKVYKSYRHIAHVRLAMPVMTCTQLIRCVDL